MNLKTEVDRRKIVVLVLALSAIALYVTAYFFPMWGFYLYAPQYPFGLSLGIYLDRLSGDTSEIDILNHYIGMAKLNSAAQFERAIAVYLLAAIALISGLFVFLPGRRIAKWFAVPALAFPVAFVSFMYLWMYRFGHELNPGAPVHVKPFTPTLAGTGRIGNFTTLGIPGPGIYMITGAAILIGVALLIRRKICAGCGSASTCKAICPHFTLASPPKPK